MATDMQKVLAPFEGLNRLPAARQIGLLFGLAASIALGIGIVMWAQTPNYSPLYGSLSEKDAGAVMQSLQNSGVSFQLDEKTGAVLVPSRQLHDIRLKLAAEGLPKGTAGGFESLGGDSAFGTSQFLETQRFYRALESELARSIMSLNNVQAARVHLAIPKQSVFTRNRQLPSASVIVNLFPGRVLDGGQVAAVAHLVASSVPNLESGRVSIVDQRGQLLTDLERSHEMEMTSGQYDYTRKLEKTYVERVEHILSPIVGAEGVRAQVVADVDFTVTERTQEQFNSDAPALRSEQIVEQRSSGAAEGGVPGALSNQPPGETSVPETTRPVGSNASSAEQAAPVNTTRRATSNYELDKTISHTRSAPGQVRRLSVAVVIDDRLLESGARRPHTPEEIERITALIKDAVGFDAQRGDSVNVTNTAFRLVRELEPLPEPPLWEQPWVWDAAKQLGGVLAVALLMFGVLRPVMRALAEKAPIQPALPQAGGELADDRLILSQPNASQKMLPPSKDLVDKQVNDTRALVEKEPQLVAQMVKQWVGDE